MHGELHEIKFLTTKKESNRIIEYKLLFPVSIICPKGSFIIEPKDGSSIFTTTLSFRFSWLIQKFARRRIEAIAIHMKEEGENLRKILENEI
ncbi:MAG: hypothetical protein ACFFAJ_10525 [Candidatus Hodarchaeota archaeon]